RHKAILNYLKSLFDRYRLEVVIYRALRALTLTAVLFQFDFHLDPYSSVESAGILIWVALMTQLVLFMELPANDLMPLRNKSIDVRAFYTGELRFVLILTAAVFFLQLDLNPYLFGCAAITNFALQSTLFYLWRKYILSSRKSANSRITNRETKNIIIVGAMKRGIKVADHLLAHPELNIHILGFIDHGRQNLWRYRDIPLIDHPDNIHIAIARNQVDFVIMAMEAEDFVYSQKIFQTVEKMGIKICLMPDIYERTISKCRTSSLNGKPVLLYHSVPENRIALSLKVVVDRVGALVVLILSLPLMAMAAAAIKIDSEGPILYRQKRTGRNGRVFEILKLRTMTADAEKLKIKLTHLNEMSGPVFKIKNDPRITRIGAVLRKFSIDELPQLFNVIKGDMSLVGPRPPLPKEVEQYAPWQHRRLSVKPGVTCLWQINGRNKINFEEWMRLDLQYIDRWSFREDVRILARTMPVVVKGDGAS
ncbi:MAG: sugar transferase, partial [candidate division Zixibacteria bacterium]|nr:sugar transferase [candidate division Zixibacteria bacterium]